MQNISIHALLAESDFYYFTLHVLSQTLFLSTLSLRRATEHLKVHLKLHCISIHALLAESDNEIAYQRQINQFLSTLSLRRATLGVTVFPGSVDNFYPRSPCGERPTDMRQRLIEFRFLSTLSLRRATIKPIFSEINTRDFYPRSPCGERRVTVLGIQHKVGISIHALLAESDALR